jgi:hypothetical protein
MGSRAASGTAPIVVDAAVFGASYRAASDGYRFVPGRIRSNPRQSLEPMVPSDGIYRSKRRLLGDSLCSLIAEDTRRIVKTIGGFGV